MAGRERGNAQLQAFQPQASPSSFQQKLQKPRLFSTSLGRSFPATTPSHDVQTYDGKCPAPYTARVPQSQESVYPHPPHPFLKLPPTEAQGPVPTQIGYLELRAWTSRELYVLIKENWKVSKCREGKPNSPVPLSKENHR